MVVSQQGRTTPEQASDLWETRKTIHHRLHRLFTSRDDPVRIKTPYYTRALTRSPDHSDTYAESQPENFLGSCELTHGLANHADTGYEVIDEIEARRRRKLWMALDELKIAKASVYDVVVEHSRFHTTQERAASNIGVSTKTLNEMWLGGLDQIAKSIARAEVHE